MQVSFRHGYVCLVGGGHYLHIVFVAADVVEGAVEVVLVGVVESEVQLGAPLLVCFFWLTV